MYCNTCFGLVIEGNCVEGKFRFRLLKEFLAVIDSEGKTVIICLDCTRKIVV